MSPQIEKQQFKNESGGWVGAVVIGPKGEDRGVAVEPDGHVWLSDEEQQLTANAPRQAKDNPFVKQTVIRRNPETDAEEEVEVTPLVPVDDQRYVPANERPVPGVIHPAAVAQAAATADQPSVPISDDILNNPLTRTDQVAAMGENAQPGQPAPPVPERAAAAAATLGNPQPLLDQREAAAQEAREDAAEAPEAPEEQAAAAPAPGSEETGAAVPPQTPAPEGEYAAREEVGTPVEGTPPAAPTPPPPAAPWSPGSDPDTKPPQE